MSVKVAWVLVVRKSRMSKSRWVLESSGLDVDVVVVRNASLVRRSKSPMLVSAVVRVLVVLVVKVVGSLGAIVWCGRGKEGCCCQSLWWSTRSRRA